MADLRNGGPKSFRKPLRDDVCLMFAGSAFQARGPAVCAAGRRFRPGRAAFKANGPGRAGF